MTVTNAQHQADIHPSASIHPTSKIAPGAIIEEDVIIGPHCSIGAGTRIRMRAIIVQNTSIGKDNDIHPYAVLGGDPQDRAFNAEHPGELIIGDNNIFREAVTLHRATHPGPPTRIGNNNYFMCQSHAGHNAQVGDNNTIGNSSCLAGHATIGDRNVLSSWVGIHQFVRVGDGTMFQAGGAASQHVPPYVIMSNQVNGVAGLNAVGLRRNPNLTDDDRRDIKRAYRALYRTRGARSMAHAVDALRAEQLTPAAKKFVNFFYDALNEPEPRRRRGVCGGAGGRNASE
ncbi:MAG: acyl-ACP--UDP-N-acetylglucosamine O-acyltransferase [Phycisphaerales bacterium]|nr:acyl-ACP--UDP-N-acetylglucosamine O-acyltransferase [Phycisphaerales bacterium]